MRTRTIHRIAGLALCIALFASTSIALAATEAVDPLVPLVAVEFAPGSGTHGPQTVTVSATDVGGSGIASTHYEIDVSQEQTYTGKFVLSRPGTHLVRAWTFDHEGRRGSTSATVDVTTVAAVRSTPVQGADRIITAIEASKKAYKDPLVPDPEGHRTVVLATGYNWPDALGASSLAGAVDGPILLTPTMVLPTQVAAELVRLGADRVLIVGGTSAVSKAVADTCLMVPGVREVERVSGVDRYATAIEIAQRTRELRGPSPGDAAFVATGMDFPDALGASAVAAAHGHPVYLAPPGAILRSDVAQALAETGVRDPIILGGTKAVSAGVAQGVQAATGSLPTRLSGGNRYDTARAVAAWAVANHLLYWDGAAIATGLGYADAICGGAMQGRNRSVLLLTDPAALDTGVENALIENRYIISELRFLGGEAVLSPELREVALAAVSKE